MAHRLALPPPVPGHRPAGFPVLGTIAPLLVAGVLWAVTQSPFAALFAALTPVIAIAATVDSRLAARRETSAAGRLRAGALAHLAASVDREQASRVENLLQQTPPATRLLAGAGSPPRPSTTSADGASPVVVVLGMGPVPSGIELARDDGGYAAPPSGEEADLVARAAVHRSAPVRVDARPGIAVLGSPSLARAVGRSIRVQLLAQGADEGLVTVCRGETAPPACATVLAVRAVHAVRILRAPELALAGEVVPELISLSQLSIYRSSVAALSSQAIGVALPDRLPLRTLLPTAAEAAGDASIGTPGGDRRGLAAAFAVGIGDGRVQAVPIDLVQDGPHAVVGGTTGSGKSELLVAWVLALTARYCPTRLTLLLVDFKGGAAFDPLRALPHCTGVITDLDDGLVDRAVLSLRAELRRREAALRDAGLRSIVESSDLNRLVVVVDEYAALLDAKPALQAVFADLAARGRSLGIHLILCTQRPSGVMRDALLANVSIRMSLRVVASEDSTAVLGSALAAAIDRRRAGRCYLALPGEALRELQVAEASPADVPEIVAAIAAGSPGPAPSGPWLEPLATRLPLPALLARHGATGHGSLLLGLLDEPERQRQDPALWRPTDDGHLLVLGGPGSGRSTLAAVLRAQHCGQVAVRMLPGDVEAAWDALLYEREEPRGGVLVIDDVDLLLQALDPEHAPAASDMIVALLRRPSSATALVLMARGLIASGVVLRMFVPLVRSTVRLRTDSRDEHLLSGGAAGDFDTDLPAGAGRWRGARLQVALPDGPAASTDVCRLEGEPIEFAVGRCHLLVSTLASRRAAQLAALGLRVVRLNAGRADPAALTVIAGEQPTVLLGEPEEWLAQYALLGAFLGRSRLIFDGCTPADVRAICRRRELPPALRTGADRVWVLDENGGFARGTLPT